MEAGPCYSGAPPATASRLRTSAGTPIGRLLLPSACIAIGDELAPACDSCGNPHWRERVWQAVDAKWLLGHGITLPVRARLRARSVVETDIPARLDRLPWGRFHTLVVAALGITWILDGLEVTLAGAVAGALKQSPVLQFSNTDVGLAGSAYLAGAVLGAMFFGWLTDRLGRKKLFFITLAVYLVGNGGDRALVEFLELLRCSGSSPAPASAANTRPSTPRSRSSCRRACAAGPILPSTAASGSAPRSARPVPSCCSTRLAAARTSAGALAFVIGAALEPDHLLHAHVASGEPALADDPRPRRRGGSHRGGHRGQVPARRATSWTAGPLPNIRLARPHPHAAARGGSDAASRSQRQRTCVGLEPDGGAGILLQRHLLHLCAHPDGLLRRPCRPGRLVHPAVRGRQFPGPAPPRAPVRHARPPADARLHLCDLRRAAGG